MRICHLIAAVDRRPAAHFAKTADTFAAEFGGNLQHDNGRDKGICTRSGQVMRRIEYGT
jgi:hypothetical protein